MAILYCLEFLETVSDPDGSIVQSRINNELINYYKPMELRGEQTAKYDKLNKIIMLMLLKEWILNDLHHNHNNNEYSMVVDRTLITFKELAHYSNFDNLQYLIQTMLDFAITDIEDKNTCKIKIFEKQTMNLMRDLKS